MYPTSNSLASLDPSFGPKVKQFLDALAAAGASVQITATKRPPERAYLMHYSWCIWKDWKGTTAANIPAFVPQAGESAVDIQWLHQTPSGQPDLAASKNAAHQMVMGYSISNLHVPPALRSNHIAGKALDMVISWSGTLSIKDKMGAIQAIASAPRDGTNQQLISVGKSYGVYHLVNVMADPPHWSYNGH
jgi:hypothetical protein